MPRHALREEARTLVQSLAPLRGREDDALVGTLATRITLEAQLGLSTTLLAERTTGVYVLGPLLVAVTGAFLAA
ncbi:hypothetical protein KIN34_01595 [Cellulomonas sp. DKR-3]|uniref:Uncharacterized protein n=1 Tax=Cellulomonas fulva TaxID=2835530 RepID=A0ABS5TV03_9CELL|nr:hypothetical protein [Cellulomonas fulva]MBT0992984.1 hypothetical protein [Cellulomonas fulva]